MPYVFFRIWLILLYFVFMRFIHDAVCSVRSSLFGAVYCSTVEYAAVYLFMQLWLGTWVVPCELLQIVLPWNSSMSFGRFCISHGYFPRRDIDELRVYLSSTSGDWACVFLQSTTSDEQLGPGTTDLSWEALWITQLVFTVLEYKKHF